MKILLINPKHYKGLCQSLPPLGLMYIASFLKDDGYKDIKMLDLDLLPISKADLENEIKKSNIVGVSAFTTQFNHAIEISKLCKKNRVFSVVGGVHITPLVKESLIKSDFDVAVKGEGEKTFLEILKSLESGINNLPNISGLAFKKNSDIIETPDRNFIEDLDRIPFPDRDIIPITKYKAKRTFFNNEYTIMITSRGCPNSCIFCQSPISWKKRIRYRSPENVFEEIKELYFKYGFRSIFFEDDVFTLDRKRAEKVCQLIIENKLKLEWACGTRPNSIDNELLVLMKSAGCVRVSMGAESGDAKILKDSKKGYALVQIKKGFNTLNSSGISSLCYMMIGLPGENLKTFFRSVSFARSLKADQYQWTIVVPFPGTEIYNQKLVDILTLDYSKWTYWSPVIKIGFLRPWTLTLMQRLADIMTRKEYLETPIIILIFYIFLIYFPKEFVKLIINKFLTKNQKEFLRRVMVIKKDKVK